MDMQEFEFTDEADKFATNVATMTLYQVLLGRDPENSYVIEESKTQSVGALFRSFVRSAEFSDFVLSPLQRNERLRHELTSPAPSVRHRDWLASLLVISPTQRVNIVAAASWRDFFCALLGLPSDKAVDEAPQPLDHPEDLPVLHPAAPEIAAAEPSLMSAVLEEISQIEQRLEHLKTLLHKMGGGVLH